MTNKEAIEELESLIEHCSSFVEHKHHEPWESDIEALKLAIKALDLVSRLDGFKYVTTEVLLRKNVDAHFEIYKRGWNDAIQATIDASDRPVTDIIKTIKENEVGKNDK